VAVFTLHRRHLRALESLQVCQGPIWLHIWEGAHLRCIRVVHSSRVCMVNSSLHSSCLFRNKGRVQVSPPLRRQLRRTMGSSLSSIRSLCTLILQVMVVKVYNSNLRNSNRTLQGMHSKSRPRAILSSRNNKDGQPLACRMHRMGLLLPLVEDPS
jgi:hypothetical protein